MSAWKAGTAFALGMALSFGADAFEPQERRIAEYNETPMTELRATNQNRKKNHNNTNDISPSAWSL